MKKQTMIDTLFYGGINVNGRHCNPCAEFREISRKIEQERQYFMEKMSPDDRLRFDRFERLFLSADTFEQQDCFAYGLRLGILLMCEVFTGEDLRTE